MLVAEEAVEIRVLKRQGKSIREIARTLDVSRNTVRRYLRGEGLPRYQRQARRPGKLDAYKGNFPPIDTTDRSWLSWLRQPGFLIALCVFVIFVAAEWHKPADWLSGYLKCRYLIDEAETAHMGIAEYISVFDIPIEKKHTVTAQKRPMHGLIYAPQERVRSRAVWRQWVIADNRRLITVVRRYGGWILDWSKCPYSTNNPNATSARISHSISKAYVIWISVRPQNESSERFRRNEHPATFKLIQAAFYGSQLPVRDDRIGTANNNQQERQNRSDVVETAPLQVNVGEVNVHWSDPDWGAIGFILAGYLIALALSCVGWSNIFDGEYYYGGAFLFAAIGAGGMSCLTCCLNAYPWAWNWIWLWRWACGA
jgi:hypothetical protein